MSYRYDPTRHIHDHTTHPRTPLATPNPVAARQSVPPTYWCPRRTKLRPPPCAPCRPARLQAGPALSVTASSTPPGSLPWAPLPLPWCYPCEKLNFATAAGGGCCCCRCWYLCGGGGQGKPGAPVPSFTNGPCEYWQLLRVHCCLRHAKWHIPSGVRICCKPATKGQSAR